METNKLIEKATQKLCEEFNASDKGEELIRQTLTSIADQSKREEQQRLDYTLDDVEEHASQQDDDMEINGMLRAVEMIRANLTPPHYGN